MLRKIFRLKLWDLKKDCGPGNFVTGNLPSHQQRPQESANGKEPRTSLQPLHVETLPEPTGTEDSGSALRPGFQIFRSEFTKPHPTVLLAPLNQSTSPSWAAIPALSNNTTLFSGGGNCKRPRASQTSCRIANMTCTPGWCNIISIVQLYQEDQGIL